MLSLIQTARNLLLNNLPACRGNVKRQLFPSLTRMGSSAPERSRDFREARGQVAKCMTHTMSGLGLLKKAAK
jgi:hypothetical protein